MFKIICWDKIRIQSQIIFLNGLIFFYRPNLTSLPHLTCIQTQTLTVTLFKLKTYNCIMTLVGQDKSFYKDWSPPNKHFSGCSRMGFSLRSVIQGVRNRILISHYFFVLPRG